MEQDRASKGKDGTPAVDRPMARRRNSPAFPFAARPPGRIHSSQPTLRGPETTPMNRRQFFQSAAATGLALQQFPFGAFAAAGDKAPRVGLIGTGWYGKGDL